MFQYDNRTALVTGASSGIGAAFARALAARGAHLVLVARSKDKLDALAAALSEEHGIRAHAVVADLSSPGAAARVFEQTRALGIEVDVLINNAGFATYGAFDAQPIERQREEILLNVSALVE